MDHDVDHAIFFNKVKQARSALDGMTKDKRKLAISFLQQIFSDEEDAAATTTNSNDVVLIVGEKQFKAKFRDSFDS